MFSDTEVFYKIGVSSRANQSRIKEFVSGLNKLTDNNYTYEMLIEMPMLAYAAAELEKALHTKLQDHRYVTSIVFAGHTECFTTIEPVKDMLVTNVLMYDMRPLRHMLHMECVKQGYDISADNAADIIEHAVLAVFNKYQHMQVIETDEELYDHLCIVAADWLLQDDALDLSKSLVSVERIGNILLSLRFH